MLKHHSIIGESTRWPILERENCSRSLRPLALGRNQGLRARALAPLTAQGTGPLAGPRTLPYLTFRSKGGAVRVLPARLQSKTEALRHYVPNVSSLASGEAKGTTTYGSQTGRYGFPDGIFAPLSSRKGISRWLPSEGANK
jgi:hypothetical protein